MKGDNNPLHYYEQTSVRYDMMALIPEAPANVLELGCGIGVTGAALREKYDCKVTGIDISPLAIDGAAEKKCYKRLLVCDLDQRAVPSEIESERFDCILYPDVLEHLKDPLNVIVAHMKLLTPQGVVISSIPNIRHYSIVKDLLFKGNWTYQELGILDSTHLRFFTKKEMIRLFEQVGLNVTVIKPRSLAGPVLLKKMNRLFLSVFEEFLTEGYDICACRK